MTIRTRACGAALGATLVPRLPLVAAIVAGLGAHPNDARLALTGAATPGGSVRLTWTLTGAEAPSGVTLIRSSSREGLDSAEFAYPATRWRLPAHRRGAWQDAAAADGTTYHYRLAADTPRGPITSAVFTLTTPERPLTLLTKPALRIDKRAFVLTVLERGRVAKRYPIALGGAPTRRKLHFDNASTPEGVYRIAGVQPRATYHRAYDVSYPNALDRVRYRLASAGHPEFPAIGGEIQIHGRGIHANWTHGCIALRDDDMDELFGQPAIRLGTEVRIWGGELSEREVDAMAAAPDAAALRTWKTALARRGIPTEARWGPALWEALGTFQRSEKLPVTCQPDPETARRLGL